jgi:predicted enzyme related to lactoylglutathione lyase
MDNEATALRPKGAHRGADPWTTRRQRSARRAPTAEPTHGQPVWFTAAMAAVLTEIVIDCRDPLRVATFWAAVLDWRVVEDERGFCWASATGEPTPPLLVFVPVPEAKSVKNRIHLDVNPSGADQADELPRLLALGATEVDVGQGDVPWIVLADPEGNEFCLLARRLE